MVGQLYIVDFALGMDGSQYLLYCKYVHVCCFAAHDLDVFMRSLESAVSVERVFSGGCNTVSLGRASLKPETIWAVMIAKYFLLLARAWCLRQRRLF
jgi:hypothetical protein